MTDDLILGFVVGFILGGLAIAGLYFYLLFIYEPPSLSQIEGGGERTD